MTELLLKAGEWSGVAPERAGWRYLSFRVETGPFAAETGEEEICLVGLGGTCHVVSEGESWQLGGRASVFDGMPSALYLPRESSYRVEGDAEVAVCGALCDRRRDPVFIAPGKVEIEIRGAGNATRQINHIVKPEFPAERLLVVEVFTPSGNWSSYPPHKHDEDQPPGEVVLEETYYYRTAHPEAFAVQRLYSPRHDVDVTVTVRDGDLMLVPYGYHTTCAAHGYDLYYLNALAGDRRSMAAADDPELAWVRPAWESMAKDPRVPLIAP
ncbi:MAG TPA: 5-deoxy-glucuronate isomerase [Gaiellaceae bacterium]|nr:5-deoxy-glucuronate isomerase [Gaiellaceae bacterium]